MSHEGERAGALKPIPVVTAKRVALRYGYDQIIIIGRRCGDGGGEHCTTYGRTEEHCSVAARIGDFFKHELMGWPRKTSTPDPATARVLEAAVKLCAKIRTIQSGKQAAEVHATAYQELEDAVDALAGREAGR